MNFSFQEKLEGLSLGVAARKTKDRLSKALFVEPFSVPLSPSTTAPSLSALRSFPNAHRQAPQLLVLLNCFLPNPSQVYNPRSQQDLRHQAIATIVRPPPLGWKDAVSTDLTLSQKTSSATQRRSQGQSSMGMLQYSNSNKVIRTHSDNLPSRQLYALQSWCSHQTPHISL